MELKINIYGDCTSDEPIKTYVVKRILFKTATEISALSKESAAKGDNEQMDLVLKMLKTIFPDFEDDDINGIDPLEFGAFMRKFSSAMNGVVANAEKN